MAEMKPASRLACGQFINIQRLHVAKLLTDEAGGTATYDTPVDLGKVLRSIDIKPSNSSADLYADGQSIDTATNTASYELTFDTAALPLEYVAYLLGHKCENGVMIANKDDVAPYFAVMFQSDKRNGLIHLLHIYSYKKRTLKGMYAPLPRVSGVGSKVIDAIMDFQNFCLFSRVNAL